MPFIRIRPSWHLPESLATPESAFLDRRAFLAGAAAGLLLPSIGCAEEPDPLEGVAKYPTAVMRNERYKLDRDLTDARHATAFNNFYEFSTDKSRVWKLAKKLKTEPWTIEIDGHCRKKGKVDVGKLLKQLPQEERLYRFRCVETWAMAVPWIGIPMKKFLEWAEPTDKAKYVRFWTAWRPDEMPSIGWNPRDFPYYEGLRLDEAGNELTLLATGVYGRVMPNQNGAPIRLIVPWKYGFKSCKSIARIEFVEKQPPTFWNDAFGNEYGFFANVNPKVAHPRWSQAQEWMIPDQKRRPTLMFNGYGEQVASLYKGMDLEKYY